MRPVRVYSGSAPVSRTYIGGSEVWTPDTSVALIMSHSEGGGNVTGAGLYRRGADVTLVAMPSAGWTFDAWSDGIRSAERVVTARRDALFTAVFVRPDAGTLYYNENY